MDQGVPFEAYSLASAEVEWAAEILEASVTLGLVLGKAGVHAGGLLEVVPAAGLAQLAFVQVSQSSVAVRKQIHVSTGCTYLYTELLEGRSSYFTLGNQRILNKAFIF